jgi:anti-sigma regulatory factor (Ser/Thr protein kinase)
MTARAIEVPADAVTVELRVAADIPVAAVVARRVARRATLGATEAAEVATVAAELAANVVRHGGGGLLQVWAVAQQLHLCASDRGSDRFANRRKQLLRAARADADHGLGTVQRLMDGVEFVDRQGGGLCVLAWRKRRAPSAP